MSLNIVVPKPGAAGPLSLSPFEYEYNPSTRLFLVKLVERPDGSPIILKCPSLKFVRQQWPIGVKRTAGGRYYGTVRLNNKTVALHRVFLGVCGNERVRAWDGDYLNFGPHVRKKVIVSPNGTRYEYPGTVCNVYVVGRENITPTDDGKQEAFENDQRQYTLRSDDEGNLTPMEPGETVQTRIRPNADLGKQTLCFGRYVDCGPADRNECPADSRDPLPFEKLSTVDTAWKTRTRPEIEARKKHTRYGYATDEEVLHIARNWGIIGRDE